MTSTVASGTGNGREKGLRMHKNSVLQSVYTTGSQNVRRKGPITAQGMALDERDIAPVNVQFNFVSGPPVGKPSRREIRTSRKTYKERHQLLVSRTARLRSTRWQT